MTRIVAAIVACLAPMVFAATITPFSTAPSGAALPPGWALLTLPNLAPPQVAMVEDGGRTVLRLRSESAAGSVAYRLAADALATPLLSWRWKVDRVLEKADLARKDGDDFAARVYVSFAPPPESLPFAVRVRIRIAKLLYGADLPAAALCYVWDNTHAPGTSVWNP